MNDNKLIADFMGLGIDGEHAYIPDEGSPLEESMPVSELQYHTSWDWLMPVVIKIGQGGNIIKAMKDLRKYSSVRTIDDTYQAVVKFIKEHNTSIKEVEESRLRYEEYASLIIKDHNDGEQ